MKKREADDGRAFSPLSLVQEHSLTSALKVELERMIFDGSIAAGERLNESILAARFGTSRGPLREALQALGEQGLVSFTRNRGAFVRQLTIDEAQELYDLRAALDDAMRPGDVFASMHWTDQFASSGPTGALVHALNAVAANVSFVEIETDKGHDAFLLHEPELFATLRGFLTGCAEHRGLTRFWG